MKKILILLLLIANVSIGQTITEINNILSNRADATITTTAGSALNTDIITGDFSIYKSIKVSLAGTFVATWTVQFCNEPTFTVPLTGQVYSENTSTWIAGTGTAAAQFSIPTNQARYVRIRVTAFTSGSIVATASGSGADTNIGLTEGAFNTRVPTVAQKTGALSMPVVPASDYVEASSLTWVANVAGTGYAIGEILLQSIKRNNGTVNITWTNTVTGLTIAAPTMANLSLYSPNGQNGYKTKNKYYAGNTSPSATASNIMAITNSNAFPVRIESLEIHAGNNIWSATNTAQIMGMSAQIVVGSATVVGGTVYNSLRVNGITYTGANTTVTAIANYTSVTGGTNFPLGNFIVNCPAIGPTASLSDNSVVPYKPDFLQGLILPATSTLLIVGSAIGSTPANPTIFVATRISEEL